MELKMVEQATIEPCINQTIILVPFHILLPFKIDKSGCGISDLHPALSFIEYFSNQSFVISFANIILTVSLNKKATVYFGVTFTGYRTRVDVTIDFECCCDDILERLPFAME